MSDWRLSPLPPPAGMLEVLAALCTFKSQQLCSLCVSGEQEAPGVPGVVLRPGPDDEVKI